MEYTMSMYLNKGDMISDMLDEITQLRAELEQERELADRLAEALGEMQVDDAYGDRQEYWFNAYNARRNK